MAPTRLPKFVQAFIDRWGTPRFYFRRRGFRRVPLPGSPWSPEFMAAYVEAMAGQPQCPIVERSAKPGTINFLAISYFNSTAFRSMKPSTQRAYRNIIDRFRKEDGDNHVGTLQRRHIVRMMELRKRPQSANGLRRVLRAMMKHAIDIGLRDDDPTRDVRAVRVKSGGFHSWTEEEIAQFEARHPVGTKPRLAQALLLCTGQRRGDVVRMGRQHVRDNAIHVEQEKTGMALEVPIHDKLSAIIAATPSGNLTFLVTEYGKPFSPAGFGNWFREQCNAAGLKHCTAHGLRKAAARRLAEAGCTVHEIAAITGHASLREVRRYTQAADQKRLAITAMQKIKTRTEVSNLSEGLTKKAKIS